jgi:SulP family sulfate permease
VPLVPKLFTTLRTYNRQQFTADLVAGVIVGVVAVPLAVAFAIASGVTPDRGLWTAIIAGFLISALGGSRVQIGGPTGAFVVIVYGIVQKYGVDGLTIATIMAGFLLIGFGLARWGAVIKFIPHPVIIGFTSGIAVIIFSGQIKDLLGLHIGTVPADFLERMAVYGKNLGSFTPEAAAVAAATLAFLILWPRLGLRIPGPFMALILSTVAVQLLHLPVETIGSRFGNLHLALPHPSIPGVSLSVIRELAMPAVTIAMLGGIESLLSAVVADGMIGGNHRSNMELVAQGIANVASPLFGGIPATGAIARTATNVKNGGRTPVAGIAHALTLLVLALFFGQWLGFVPLAALAGILVIVSYHMSEWRTVVAELRAPKSDVLVMVVTFALTVLVDLTVAIQVGMVLALVLFVRRMVEVTDVSQVAGTLVGEDPTMEKYLFEPDGIQRSEIPANVAVFEINGPFFFGAAAHFKETLSQIASRPRVMILRMRHVPFLDSTALKLLKDLVEGSARQGTQVILSELQSQPANAVQHSALWGRLGSENMLPSFDLAVATARGLVGRHSAEITSPEGLRDISPSH